MVPQTAQPQALPECLYLEVTNRCNLRCRACVQYRGMKEPPRDLSFDEVVRIVDQVPRLKRAVLHGIGEPLLNAELPQMIRYLKKRGVYVLFNSNALLLSPELADELIAVGLDEFRASLDGATESTYAGVRGSKKFSQVMDNLAVLIQKRNEGARSVPQVCAWLVGTRENIRELPDMILLASRVGIDEVYLQRLAYPLDGPGYGLARREKAISDAEPETEGIIAGSTALSNRLGIRLVASGLTSPIESLNRRSSGESPWRQCRRPWEVAYITARGNVLPCCISPFATLDYDSLILGNVFEQGLEQIWAGEKYQQFRRRHQSSDPPASCAGCGVEWSL
jgi:radical SAM protein with 4Fe4S-binding SPASM domain